MTGRLCLLIAVAAAAAAPAAAAAAPVVPSFHQRGIAKHAPEVAYVPARLVVGWHFRSLGPDRFADVGLGRIVASGHRIR